MDKKTQIQKAEDFLAHHHGSKMLVLPNIWDPLGARLLESLDYPAVATASSAVAWSLGYDDGQQISFDVMLDVIRRIASAVDVPLSADIEGGYAEDPDEVAENMRQVIQAGAVGINIEDSTIEGGSLHPTEFQAARIKAVRAMAEQEGIPLVINARIDVFLRATSEPKSERLAEAITRAKAYVQAGADCIYPITLGDIESLKAILATIKAPLNVYVSPSAASMRELEAAGIRRVSLASGLIRASLTAMKKIAVGLQNYDSSDLFSADTISSAEAKSYVSKDKMSFN